MFDWKSDCVTGAAADEPEEDTKMDRIIDKVADYPLSDYGRYMSNKTRIEGLEQKITSLEQEISRLKLLAENSEKALEKAEKDRESDTAAILRKLDELGKILAEKNRE